MSKKTLGPSSHGKSKLRLQILAAGFIVALVLLAYIEFASLNVEIKSLVRLGGETRR
eukprot:CAMPEP_0172557374 /NCGR_PEP_ID=MMETSP1067-20121228/72890_1 /TAXON_ID=265564 ORGANISM="Thalassiosira punctigera, Strain Tpunct2005C2" /NCGR_SAMPLE_ID=MMETSP1067 /ASSEMBLY_ACC=CAM_ASM_000444 /LENGTH=56 /DNA_ID=CAMNT_0013346437 /DNA_START=131 /DNA_END=298 /DNA_ORIENTATION=+